MSSGIETIDQVGLCPLALAMLGSSYIHALARRSVTTPVHGISKNNAFSGHSLPNYAASLKYAFSADIIRQTLATERDKLFPISFATLKLYMYNVLPTQIQHVVSW